MSISTELARIATNRNTIRNKFIELGLATSTSTLDDLATKASQIINQGSISANVKEGETYTIPRGYHSGSGTVSGVAGGGSYALQSKIVTPTKEQQSITSSEGYYGLSDVTVEPIPDAYQDVSNVTAEEGDVLANKIIVTSTGTVTAGTMPNNGTVNRSLNATTTSYTIPKGYHSGSGTVSITVETKTATPTTSSQTINATSGKLLSSVTVNAIPEIYANTSSATATSAQILDGMVAFVNDGSGKGIAITGSMANNGSVTGSIDGLSVSSYNVPAGYTTGGTISLTNDIEQALAAI